MMLLGRPIARITAPAILWSLLASPAWPQEATSVPPLTSGEVSGIRAQIEQNWNVPIDALETCKTRFELRVSLLNDGTVKHVEILGNETITDGCRIWVDSARRAVLRASPIKLLAGKEMTSIKVRFDPNEIAKSLLE